MNSVVGSLIPSGEVTSRATTAEDQWARLDGHEFNWEEPDMLVARACMLWEHQRLLSEVVQRAQRAGQGSSRDAPMTVSGGVDHGPQCHR
jgi:hypothetical protein